MTPEKLIETWYAATIEDSPDEGVMFALLRLARRHPQWFDADLTDDPLQMLFEASTVAQDDMVSRKLIEAAYWIVKANEDRLADPPQPESEPLPMTDDPIHRLSQYAAGYDAGFSEGHAAGYRKERLRILALLREMAGERQMRAGEWHDSAESLEEEGLSAEAEKDRIVADRRDAAATALWSAIRSIEQQGETR